MRLTKKPLREAIKKSFLRGFWLLSTIASPFLIHYHGSLYLNVHLLLLPDNPLDTLQWQEIFWWQILHTFTGQVIRIDPGIPDPELVPCSRPLSPVLSMLFGLRDIQHCAVDIFLYLFKQFPRQNLVSFSIAHLALLRLVLTGKAKAISHCMRVRQLRQPLLSSAVYRIKHKHTALLYHYMPYSIP